MSAYSNPISARPQFIASAVTALIAGWFFVSTGAIIADAASPRTATNTQMAARAGDQTTVTPEGRLKLTVVAQRPKQANPALQTAAMRHAPNI